MFQFHIKNKTIDKTTSSPENVLTLKCTKNCIISFESTKKVVSDSQTSVVSHVLLEKNILPSIAFFLDN